MQSHTVPVRIADQLAYKSLQQIIKVSKPYESIIEVQGQEINTEHFKRHFRTTAHVYASKRWLYYEQQKQRVQTRPRSQESWMIPKRRSPSFKLYQQPRQNMFNRTDDIRPETSYQVEDKQRSFSIMKQTQRKNWMIIPQSDKYYEQSATQYDKLKRKTGCYVNYQSVDEKPNRQLSISVNYEKANETLMNLKSKAAPGNLDFSRLIDRSKMSPYQLRVINKF
ncbi:hypothetical protein pb186bvf_012522 [Paramecium bursaria]